MTQALRPPTLATTKDFYFEKNLFLSKFTFKQLILQQI